MFFFLFHYPLKISISVTQELPVFLNSVHIIEYAKLVLKSEENTVISEASDLTDTSMYE